jgi:BON domain-containing protein
VRSTRRGALSLAAAIFALPASADGGERKNRFDDPFLQVTNGIAACPVPEGPLLTEDEARVQAHVRGERGLRCYLEGKCRLPNSYMYDKDIVARVQKAILHGGRFADTSVWAESQRRWVTLKGCVRRKEQAAELVRLVKSIEEVERVFDQLTPFIPK